MKLSLHLKQSIVNSGLVTVATSLAMTYINSRLIFITWFPNWLISWFIVCNYVYWFAPKVSKRINNFSNK